MSQRNISALIALLIIGGTTAKAQSVKDSVNGKSLEEVTLESVIIVSSRAPKHITDIPGTVWVIEQTKFNNK